MKNSSYIIKLNKIPSDILTEIESLQRQCIAYNNSDFELYTGDDDIDTFSDTLHCFHLYYINHTLAGFLSFFVQGEACVCMYGCVLPKYRRQKIFTTLYHSAIFELSIYPKLLNGIEFHLPDCDTNDYSPAIHFLNKNGFNLHHHEYLMNYEFTSASMSDTENMPGISDLYDMSGTFDTSDAYGLSTEYDEDTDEFLIWKDDTYIGGCRIFFPEALKHGACATIYDYEILPDYRGKGHGKHGLLSILEDLKTQGFHNVILHVSGRNKKAHNLYLSCGFTVKSSLSVYQPSHRLSDN